MLRDDKSAPKSDGVEEPQARLSLNSTLWYKNGFTGLSAPSVTHWCTKVCSASIVLVSQKEKYISQQQTVQNDPDSVIVCILHH